MTSRALILWPAVLVACIVVTEAYGQSGPVSEDAWKGLQYGTGWITLGVLKADSGEWAAGEPGFEILGNTDKRKPVRSIEGGPASVVLPTRGDRIRLRGAQVVWLLDFTLSGEKNRLISPTTRGRREKTDETGISLPAGSVLIVRDVQIERPAGGLKSIWLRVTSDQSTAAKK